MDNLENEIINNYKQSINELKQKNPWNLTKINGNFNKFKYKLHDNFENYKIKVLKRGIKNRNKNLSKFQFELLENINKISRIKIS